MSAGALRSRAYRGEAGSSRRIIFNLQRKIGKNYIFLEESDVDDLRREWDELHEVPSGYVPMLKLVLRSKSGLWTRDNTTLRLVRYKRSSSFCRRTSCRSFRTICEYPAVE